MTRSDAPTEPPSRPQLSTTHRPFRRAVLRGLGVVLPPLLTIVFLLWIWNSVQTYLMTPMKNLVRSVAVRQVWDVWEDIPDDAEQASGDAITFTYADKTYRRLPSEEWIPLNVYRRVRQNPGVDLPLTAEAYYRRDIEDRWFRPSVIVPIFFCVFILLLYLLGKIIAARVGRALWNYFEQLIHHLPFISTVYGTVKKVTDIVFTEAELEFNRVVAVEYPRRGIWSVGFVTGESLPDIRTAADEPVLSVLMPTSPMPATGFTISVRKGEAVELNLSVDQAFQFIVSCGVVVPGLVAAHKLEARTVADHVREAVSERQPPAATPFPPDCPPPDCPPPDCPIPDSPSP